MTQAANIAAEAKQAFKLLSGPLLAFIVSMPFRRSKEKK